MLSGGDGDEDILLRVVLLLGPERCLVGTDILFLVVDRYT